MNWVQRNSNSRNRSRRSISLAALSAAALLSAATQESSAQTWVNPNTGNWSSTANWVGGVAPTSGAATNLVFNATAAQAYTATNDIANPFEFASLVTNNSGSGAITLAGSAFTGGTATAGAFIRVNNTGAGATSMNNGGSLYALRVGQGLTEITGGTWNLLSTQRQNDDIGVGAPPVPVNDGFWSLSVGDTSGQTARFSQTGGTINAANAFIGSAPNSVGIATFSGAGTIFNAINATPDGLLGVGHGSGSITVLNGAQTNSRRVEVAKQANSVGFLRIDGTNSRVNTTNSNAVFASGAAANATLSIANSGALISGGGFFTATNAGSNTRITIDAGTMQATGVAVVTGGGGSFNPTAGSTTISLTNGARWQTGTNTFGQEPGLVTINVDATSSVNATTRTIVSGQGGSVGVGTANVNVNGGTFTSGSFINIGGGFATALGDPLEGGLGSITMSNGALLRAGSNMTLGPSPLGGGTITAVNSTVGTGTGQLAVSSAATTTGRMDLTNSTLTVATSMFVAARDGGVGELILNNTPATIGGFLVVAGGGGTINGGTGTVTMMGGSNVSAVNMNVGQDSLGNGNMTVTGANTQLTVSTGAGTSSFVIGSEATANGQVTVSNGARLNLNGGTAQMVIGNNGNGTFNLSNSSLSVGNTVFVGAGTTSTGFAHVSGATMTMGAQLQVGGSGGTAGGASTMNVLNQSVVTTVDLMNVYTTGTLNIGAGSTKSSVSIGGDSTVNGNVFFNAGTFNTTGTLGVGGNVVLSSAARNGAGTPSNKKLLEAGQATLTVSGVIDLDDNDMLLHDTTAGALQKYENFVRTARNNGLWNQPGITSTAAKNAVPKNKNLGVIRGSDFHAGNGGAGALFNGRTVATTDTLIKFTFNGDTDLNGVVNFDDYARTDGGFNNGRTGWFNGDFDYSGVVNFDDYSLIDQAFNTQGTVVLASGEGAPAGPGFDRQIVTLNSAEAVQMQAPGYAFDRGDALEQVAVADGVSGGGLQAVPEPATVSILGAATLGALMRRTRRQRA